MTFPVWIPVGPWRLHPHLVFELFGYACSIAAYRVLRERFGDHVDAAQRWSLSAAAIVGAVIGSRFLFWLEDPAATLARLSDFQHLIGGQTIVGGLLGGWLAVELQKVRLGITQPTGDLFSVPIALGTAVGRIGCFLTGLSDGTHGIASSLPWAYDLGDGIRRHPAALYESVFMFLLAWWLAVSPAAGLRRGDRFKWLMTLYLSFRLAIEFIKPGVPLAAGLTAIQWACLVGLTCNVPWLRRRASR